MDRSGRIVWLALQGYTQLAADTILDKGNRGTVVALVGDATRQLTLAFADNQEARANCYGVAFEIALNLLGRERYLVGFSEEETKAALGNLTRVIKEWEAKERREGTAMAVELTVGRMLGDMKKVLMGQGMTARMGEEIAAGLDRTNIGESFVVSCASSIQDNVYYKMVSEGIIKFGNDSATGLRWARHLGAVQVSSNPVSAGRAFDETPELWETFKAVAERHPEWAEDPEANGDEVTMFGTITSLLPNVLDFRPIALLSGFQDGMVSIQLNPFRASTVEGSLGDAKKIYRILREVLLEYDTYLVNDQQLNFRGRPNVVFKVAVSDPNAIEITESLNRLGIGTNNTATSSVAQELAATMAAMRGLAKARRLGTPITRVYVTNMEGRLEDHLREAQAEAMLRDSLARCEDPDSYMKELTTKLGVPVGNQGASLDERVRTVCSKKYLKSLTDERFIGALKGVDKTAVALAEEDIRMSGIIITRRVFEIAYTKKAAAKWAGYIQKVSGISDAEARAVVTLVDLLPASKRRAADTYLVLGGREARCVTNTEFQDQQLRVLMRSREPGFSLAEFRDSVAANPDAQVLARLMRIEDFRRAFELTPELVDELRQIGIAVSSDGGGLAPDQWSSYGVVAKTMKEFGGAYSMFRSRLVGSLKVAQPVKRHP